MPPDRIYSLPLEHVGDFAFDQQVVDVFPDMVARSVPGYASILAMTAELAGTYAKPASNLYDLGCSLGAASLLIRQRVPSDCTIHAVDSSPAMVQRLRELLPDQPRAGCRILVHEADVRDFQVEAASFAVMNFTLQFIPVEQRQGLLRNVCEGLLPGAAFVLSEKVCFEDQPGQELMTSLHHAFKAAHGYSELEIAQKRTALEHTLIPETMQVHLDRLHRVGFALAAPWFQCFNFVSILAVK